MGEVGLEIVNQIGGAVTAVAIQDNLAYLGIGSRLAVADISDQTQPKVIFWSSILPGVVAQITLRDGLAYVALGEAGLWILDIANPVELRPLGHVLTTSPTRHFLLQNNLIYSADTRGELGKEQFMSVVDVINPSQPVEISTFALPSRVIKLLMVDNYLYIVAYPNHVDYKNVLWVVDVSDSRNPELLKSVPELAGRDMVEIEGNRLLIAEGGTLIVADVSNPASPLKMMQTPILTDWGEFYDLYEIQDTIWAIGVFGDLGYCGGLLYALDISELNNIRRISDFSVDCHDYDVISIDGLPYLTDGNVMINISNPQHPISSSFIGKIPTTSPIRQLGFDDFLYGLSGDDVYIFDATSPIRPQLINLYKSKYTVNDMIVNGSQLYLATYWEGIVDVDMTNPDNPQETAVTNPDYQVENSIDPVFYGSRLYALLNGKLGIFDSTTLQWLGGDEEGFYGYGRYRSFAVENNTLWAWATTDEGYGLLAMDVTIPEQIRQIGFLHDETPPDNVLGIVADQGLVYSLIGDDCYFYPNFGCNDTVLNIIDVSNPGQMRQLANINVASGIQHMTKSGNMLLLVGDDLWLIDASNPTQSQVNGRFPTPGYAQDAVLINDLIYVADGAGGLLILQMTE